MRVKNSPLEFGGTLTPFVSHPPHTFNFNRFRFVNQDVKPVECFIKTQKSGATGPASAFCESSDTRHWQSQWHSIRKSIVVKARVRSGTSIVPELHCAIHRRVAASPENRYEPVH
jgi:hypothetical protein